MLKCVTTGYKVRSMKRCVYTLELLLYISFGFHEVTVIMIALTIMLFYNITVELSYKITCWPK